MSKMEARILFFFKNLTEKDVFFNNNFMQKQLNNATPYQFLALFSSSDKFTCVFAGELVFFFSSLFSLSGWDIFISSVGFLSLSRTRICLPASPSLCSCQLFWHLCVANKPNWKYLCINKWGRGAVWKRREADQSCDTSRRQSFHLSIYLFIYLSISLPVLHHGPFVWQEMDELCRWKGVQATWRRPHWSLSPLCLSLTRPVRPSVPAPSKGRLSRHKGRSERTHTHTDEGRKKHTLFWPDKWTLGDSERGTSGALSSPRTMEVEDFVFKTETEDKTDEEQSFCSFCDFI